ncbi:hypothetical protein RvY_14717 [Ramazzottius varieornatus]|uniref:Uncharacterized protein n=1 Tax=Ramazzottius varieornatus TaxID=947166 RepID=A0A1D1VW14_RAMVA|nr:hypothetical protein RvY_14717 [Ramazzottius varieornatus]
MRTTWWYLYHVVFALNTMANVAAVPTFLLHRPGSAMSTSAQDSTVEEVLLYESDSRTGEGTSFTMMN